MDEKQKAFARRYRGWIDALQPDSKRMQEAWCRISCALALGQGPPPRCPPDSGKKPADFGLRLRDRT